MIKQQNQSLLIKYTDFGIACRIGNIIYINKDLLKEKELYDAILLHETNHTDGFSKKDIVMDMSISQLKGLKSKYYLWILTHPKSLIELLPLWKYDGRWVVNPIMSVLWVFLLGVLWIVKFL